MKAHNSRKFSQNALGLLLLLLPVIFSNGNAVWASPKAKKHTHKPAQPAVLKRKSLSPAEQQKFLKVRGPGVMMGNFRSYASLLFAVADICIGSKDQNVINSILYSWYPDKELYMPTHAELFDMIARQTGSSFSYDAKADFWAFQPPSLPIPFTVQKANGWTEEERPGYVAYIPPTAPVGMDIYMMGKYSGLTPDKERKIIEHGAALYSKRIDPKSTAKTMKEVTVDGVAALYFSSPAPSPGMLWRQWAFLKNGELYVIVSAYKEEQKEQIEKDVDSMVATFHAKD
jgi:hypothetical protein